MRNFLILATLAVTATAVPTDLKQCPRVLQNANFDDLPGIPAIPANSISKPYKGLLFQGIEFTKILTPLVSVPVLNPVLNPVLDAVKLPGVLPHSGDSYGRIGLTSKLGGNAMLTVNHDYDSNKIESFRLESWYFGCTLQGTGAGAVPRGCTINVTGYKGNDNTIDSSKQVCSQTYTYDPKLVKGQAKQTLGNFDDCKGKDLQFATILFQLDGVLDVLNPLSVLLFDDLKYSTKAKAC